MPIYSHGRKKWRVRVYHRGRPHERVVEGTKKEAKDYEAVLRAKLEAGDPSEARSAPTFSDFSTTRYKAHAKATLKPATWANRRYDIATLADFFGKLKLTQINTERVDAFRTQRAREVARRTVNNELMALSAILSYAREIGIPAADPKIKKLRVPRHRRHAEAWTDEDVAAIYAACEELEPGLLPLMVFLANTGCRRGEAIALRWDEVDFERGLVRIWPRADEDDAFDTKNSLPREVPISDALRPYLERAHANRECRWVFPTRSRRRYATFPKRRFRRVIDAAGLEGGPHKFRHTFATHFLAQVPDLYLLGRILGQEHSRVTELYAHLLKDHHARARNAVSIGPATSAAELEAKKRWGMGGKIE